jgi:putative flavoprotein involved in K+ transport
VKNVIWATGFTSNYEWINISKVLDKTGNPVHSRGITQIEGLYFLGLPWQHKRGSALLLGVGEDAAYIANHISNEMSHLLIRQRVYNSGNTYTHLNK